jgi:hypothetical protein
LVPFEAAALLTLGSGAMFAQEQQQDGTTQEDGVLVNASNRGIYCVPVPYYASGNDDLVYELPL